MTRYKIVTNGEEYRVKQWNWRWPFWCEICVVTSPYSTGTIIFTTKAEAQEWIDLQIAELNRQKLKWRDANDNE